MRLLRQGRQLPATGQLEVRIPDDELDDYQALDGMTVAGAVHLLALEQIALDQTVSVLPDRPDVDAAEAWLERVRRWML